MNYEALRHFADSWGLVLMAATFLGFVGWTFRPRAADHHEAARMSIFRETTDDEGREP